jgi:large subunit ribosomal protein L30
MRRSAISLGEKKKGTVASLGIHRRNQTVYHKHSPEVAGKILLLKELLEVENVPESEVKTKEEQTMERRPPRGYKVVDNQKAKDAAWERS